MNRWYQIRHLRGGAILILIGVLALLNQWRIMSWDKSWPFFLIVLGLLALAERAAWAADARARQEAQLNASFTQPGTGTIPANPTVSASWSTPPTSGVVENSFIQAHPPAPEDPGREER